MKGKLSSKESFCYKVASAVKAVKADYHIVIKKKKVYCVSKLYSKYSTNLSYFEQSVFVVVVVFPKRKVMDNTCVILKIGLLLRFCHIAA